MQSLTQECTGNTRIEERQKRLHRECQQLLQSIKSELAVCIVDILFICNAHLVDWRVSMCVIDELTTPLHDSISLTLPDQTRELRTRRQGAAVAPQGIHVVGYSIAVSSYPTSATPEYLSCDAFSCVPDLSLLMMFTWNIPKQSSSHWLIAEFFAHAACKSTAIACICTLQILLHACHSSFQPRNHSCVTYSPSNQFVHTMPSVPHFEISTGFHPERTHRNKHNQDRRSTSNIITHKNVLRTY